MTPVADVWLPIGRLLLIGRKVIINGLLSMIETFPLEKAAEAYDRMINNRARFRVVLTMQGKSA